MVFEKLKNETPYEMNGRVGKYWKDNEIFKKSIENRPDDNRFFFFF